MSHQGSHIGTLIKPHGYKGELLLKGKPEILRELKQGIPLFIELSEQRIPFFIEEISHDPSGEKCIVQLSYIESDTEARKYVGCDVYQSPDSKTDERKVAAYAHEFAGFMVVDTSGGGEYSVTDYFDHPENPILLLECEGREVMLPLNADYIVSVDTKMKVIAATFPEGLA
jgi:16S rRNA processing protein RimM